jgi:hypothetical protein
MAYVFRKVLPARSDSKSPGQVKVHAPSPGVMAMQTKRLALGKLSM